jgi:hypothetical protein
MGQKPLIPLRLRDVTRHKQNIPFMLDSMVMMDGSPCLAVGAPFYMVVPLKSNYDLRSVAETYTRAVLSTMCRLHFCEVSLLNVVKVCRPLAPFAADLASSINIPVVKPNINDATTTEVQTVLPSAVPFINIDFYILNDKFYLKMPIPFEEDLLNSEYLDMSERFDYQVHNLYYIDVTDILFDYLKDTSDESLVEVEWYDGTPVIEIREEVPVKPIKLDISFNFGKFQQD